MKKMFAVSLVLAAALAMGCSKKNPQTTPSNTGGTQNEMKSGSDMGGATYGGDKGGGDAAPADPCAAPK
jgi:hypothetical protein